MRFVLIGLVAAALYLGIAWLFGLPPLTAGPSYYTAAPPSGRIYLCGAPEGQVLTIRFADDGRTANVQVGPKRLRLTFAGTTGWTERFKADGWTLTLDPEANLSGPGGIRFSNCSGEP